MARVFALRQLDHLPQPVRENPDDDSRRKALAREIVAQLQNEHGLVTLEEARQIAQVENEIAFFCTSCLSPVSPSQRKCLSCGGSRAARFVCERCNFALDPAAPRCPSCGHGRAVISG